MLDIRRLLSAVIVAAASVLVVAPASAAAQPGAAELTFRLSGSVVRRLPFVTRNVALYWKGEPDARVTVAFSRDGVTFGKPVDVGRDEIGAQRNNGVTYGAMLTTFRSVAVRVQSDRPMRKITVLGIQDPIKAVLARLVPDKVADQAVDRPPIIARSEWGADESLRFAGDGAERWTPTFAPIQKLVVHHTDTRNDDPNPAATVRAIYRYHAITQGWGDIGYNFLIDASGQIYKGRNSHAPGNAADSIAGEDNAGNGVTAAHARAFNSGTVGVALLGNLSNQDATLAAKQALENLLAWKADKHHIDPQGASPYTNSAGAQSVFPNIAGHRDVASSTECPGGTFYRQLPNVRNRVAARLLPS